MAPDEETGPKIEDQYPLIIARAHRKLAQLQFEKPSIRLKQAVELWEVILRYLATIVCRTYLVNDGGSEEINGRIEGFQIPSNGHWVQLLRECARRYDGEKKAQGGTPLSDGGPVSVCRRIASFYFSPLPGKRNHEAFKAALELSSRDEALDVALKPTNGHLFDLLVRVRNWMAHTAGRTEQEYAGVLERLLPVLDHLMEDLSFLADYPLYFVREVRVEKGAFQHSVDRCMGRDFEVEKLTLVDQPLNNEEVYLFERRFDEQGEAEVVWALSLSPYLIVEQCRECHRRQVFVFNKMAQKRLEFASYQCGHVFVPPGRLKDFEDTFEFLQGKIDLNTLLKGKAVGSFFQREENLAVALERRSRARAKVEEGRRHLAKGEILLAGETFDQAVEWDVDNAEARFLAAMSLILNGGALSEVLCGLRKAVELDPENGRYALALAEIYAELGETREAAAYLHRTISIDPSNRRAKALLQQIGGTEESQAAEEGGALEDA